MNVIWKKDYRAFSELKGGDVFVDTGSAFIKLHTDAYSVAEVESPHNRELPIGSTVKYNAISANGGCLAHFNANANVVLISNAKLILE